MPIRPIRTRAEHDQTLAEIERLMGAKRGTPRADRLEVLVALVTAYEATRDRIDLPEPIEAHMEERGLGQADFARLVGSRSLASAILNRKRPMSLSVIRKLAMAWDIPTDILIQPYRLERQGSPKAS